MMLVWAFLRSYWKEVVVALLVAAIAGYWYHLVHTIDAQQTQIVQLQTAVDTLKDNNTKLIATVDANNQAVSKVADASTSTIAAFNTLSTTVTRNGNTLSARLAAIKAEAKPQTCNDTIKYLIDASRTYAK